LHRQVTSSPSIYQLLNGGYFVAHYLGTNDHFPWQAWCDFAGKHKLCIYGWDATCIPPGPDFTFRSVKADAWHRLVQRIDWGGNPFFVKGGPKLEIKPWEPGTHFWFVVVFFVD